MLDLVMVSTQACPELGMTRISTSISSNLSPCREAGDPSKAKDWLPKAKQYLVTRRGAHAFPGQTCKHVMYSPSEGHWHTHHSTTLKRGAASGRSAL